MGITSLKSLIDNNPHLYDDFKLCNTPVVIDGPNLCHKLYLNENLNCLYGGEYKTFENVTRNFFDTLKCCNVEPILIFDGSADLKGVKYETWVIRHRERITTAKSISDGHYQKARLFPLSTTDVFRRVADRMGLQICQCAGEADAFIASKAKSLKCPVISSDSDFYIHDLPGGYVQYESMDWHTIHSDEDGTRYIRAKIYRLQNLLNSFNGLDRSLLPLFATLSGNDFVKKSNFAQFYGHISKPSVKRKSRLTCTKNHCNMIGLLNWLCDKSVDQAVDGVLNFMKKEKWPNLRRKIDDSLKMYENRLLKIDDSSFTVDDSSSINNDSSLKIDNHVTTIEQETVEILKNRLHLPGWMIDRFVAGSIPLPILSLLANQRLFLRATLEDFDQPSVFTCCNSIMHVIYYAILEFLHESRDENSRNKKKCRILEYSRNGSRQAKTEFEYDKEKVPKNFPSLTEMENFSENQRLSIFYDVIGLSDKKFQQISNENFPKNLRMFVLTVYFWLKNDQTNVDVVYFNALITCAYLRMVQYHVTEDEWKSSKYAPPTEENQSTERFVKNVLKLDFTKQSTNGKRPYKPDTSILHTFSQLQAVVYALDLLNSLLLRPVEPLAIENCYSGRLCYNLCKFFKGFSSFRTALHKLHCADGTESADDIVPPAVVLRADEFRTAILGIMSENCFATKPNLNPNMKRKSNKNKVKNELGTLPTTDETLLDNQFAALTVS